MRAFSIGYSYIFVV